MSLEEIQDELKRLMLEEIESLQKATFVRLSPDDEQKHESRLKRIREVSSDYVAALRKGEKRAPRDGPREVGRHEITTHEGKTMSEKPNVSLPGKVEKVIESHPTEPTKAEISIEGADPLYQEIRIENTLKDENGNQVSLKKGAEVDVTISADKEATLPKDKSKP